MFGRRKKPEPTDIITEKHLQNTQAMFDRVMGSAQEASPIAGYSMLTEFAADLPDILQLTQQRNADEREPVLRNNAKIAALGGTFGNLVMATAGGLYGYFVMHDAVMMLATASSMVAMEIGIVVNHNRKIKKADQPHPAIAELYKSFETQLSHTLDEFENTHRVELIQQRAAIIAATPAAEARLTALFNAEAAQLVKLTAGLEKPLAVGGKRLVLTSPQGRQ